MKWIRWDGDCCFDLRDTAPDSPDDDNYKDFIEEDLIDCEKHEDWREIESGVLDTATGKLRITLKPAEKVPTLREAVEAYLESNWSDYRDSASQLRASHPSHVLVSIVDALDREASTPANPYTKEAVDELLEAASEACSDIFDECAWPHLECQRMARAFLALKKQWEAANGG